MSQPSVKRATDAAASPDPKRLKKSREATPSRDVGKDGKEKDKKKDKSKEKDVEIQKRLLSNDPQLRQLFMQLANQKPESMSNKDFARRFWAARQYLIDDEREKERMQRATTHVFSQLKSRRDEGGPLKMSITKEQVGQIFQQYPVVRRAYDEIVVSRKQNERSAVDEATFWTRFFHSRLFKVLKGEPYTDHDPKDPELDKEKYLQDPEGKTFATDPPPSQAPTDRAVPLFIDLSGNESNTKWHGNVAGESIDPTMRARSRPILHVLNSTSERILAQVAPADDADAAPHAPVGLDERTYHELRLRDLAAEADDTRVVLNIRDPARIRVGSTGEASSDRRASEQAQLYAAQDPAKLLSGLLRGVRTADAGGSLDLAASLGLAAAFAAPDDAMDVDRGAPPPQHQQGAVATHLQALLGQQEAQLNAGGGARATVLTGLGAPAAENVELAHHTTTEFLHIFHAVAAGLPPGVNPLATELKGLRDTLDKVVTVQLREIADGAESRRRDKLAALKREADDVRRRTGGRRAVAVDPRDAGPGEEDVWGLFKPTVGAVAAAGRRFDELLRASTATV